MSQLLDNNHQEVTSELRRLSDDMIRVQVKQQVLDEEMKEIKVAVTSQSDRIESLKHEVREGLAELRMEIHNMIHEISREQVKQGVKIGSFIGGVSVVAVLIGQWVISLVGA